MPTRLYMALFFLHNYSRFLGMNLYGNFFTHLLVFRIFFYLYELNLQAMKQAILVTLLITTPFFAFSRTIPVKNNNTDTSLAHIPPMQEMVSDIMNITGLQADFEVKEAKVLNIEASISHRKRYILYNPEFITWINRSTHDKWGTVALLAHEIAHHLNGHTLGKSGSRPELELEADEFAGFVLSRLGASLEQSQKVMLYIATTTASTTHPARSARMEAIRKGWDKAAGSTAAK